MRLQDLYEARKDYEGEFLPGKIAATPRNIALARDFVLQKWVERFCEKYSYIAAQEPGRIPSDLTNACKFSSLFARAIFGGRLSGNDRHQFVRTQDGQVIDLNIDAQDVRDMIADGFDPHQHDAVFWGSRDHKSSVNSCKPRVADWVKEFLSKQNLVETTVMEINRLPKYDKAFIMPPAIAANDEQQKIIRYYQDHGYSDINSQLRGTQRDFSTASPEEMLTDYGFHLPREEIIRHLDDILALAPRRTKTIKTYRGERDSEHANKLAAMDVGQSYVDPAYLSTSLRPSYGFYAFAQQGWPTRGVPSNNVLSMYLVSPKVKASSLDAIGGEPSVEAEFLIGRGATYTLMDKKVIPNGNRGHRTKEVQLLIWKVT